MTCILGIEGPNESVWIAADRLSGDGSLSDVLPHSKILRLSTGSEEILLAVSGSRALYGALAYCWTPPLRAEGRSFDAWWWGSGRGSMLETLRAADQLHDGDQESSTREVMRGAFLIGMRGEVWSISESLTPERSGRSYNGQGACLIAFGAIHAKSSASPMDRLMAGMSAAHAHQPGLVQPPFDVEYLGPNNGKEG